MATLVGAKKVGPEFGKTQELVTVIYDFAADGGEVENNIVLTAQGKCVVKLHHINVLTSFTSGGAVEVSLGKGAGGTEFMSAVLKATLVANYVAASATPIKLAAAETVQLGVAVAAITAGKMEMVFEVTAAN
jgi:hypothetical protein